MLSRKLLGTALLVAMILVLSACKPTDSNASIPSESMAEAMDDSIIEHARKHADVNYVCPMHPQIVRGEPGDCPICGMALVAKAAPEATRTPAYYRHPHNPTITSPEPRKDEMGMDYVPVYENPTQDDGPPIVTIRPETLQNMGVRTALVERGALSKAIETVGYVAYDEDRMGHVHSRAVGWAEKLRVRTEGEVVKRNQVLMDLYSPEIVNAQEEYLLALEGISASGRRQQSLLEGARRRLRLLEVPDSVISTLNRTRKVQETVPILAPITGVITKLGLREGMYVKPDMELFTISDVSNIWVQVDVFEHQADQVKKGNPAHINIPALPGRTWEGEVDYIYPELDAKTRTLQIRLRFKNPAGALKPNMFVHAHIQGSPRVDALHIPREALIMTGGEDRVIQDLGDGRFQPEVVVVGSRAGDRVEILEGLQEGERIVVSGQFLIDSESNLQASFRRMQAPEPTEPADPAMAHREN
ncbi:MAG: efflux RND transporter periplasmic adaptor subunit [Candidatus Competibacteraceae bacterium]|jgi:Cu(I)/Ag(I) efflux system membrane fusion protein|nr:efflux RND transporter periplasmic adaptor subunit [Candidatus Competibacteraceae bacterium]